MRDQGEIKERICAIMNYLEIDWFMVKTQMVGDELFDELRVHFIGDAQDQTSTANEFTALTFLLLKDLEYFIMGGVS